MSSRLQHFASSIAFLSGMGASTRGIALGSPHSSVRLHTSVWLQSPLLRQGSPDSSKQHLKAFCATAGTVLPPQGAIEEVPQSDMEWGFFQSLFSCAKEGRRSTTYSRPASSELLALQRKIQDVDVENYYVTDSSGRLVCNFRTERCLFSYSGRSAAQEVPSVHFWREGLPIKGSSFWPGFGTEDIHKVHGCCSGPFEVPGHSCTQLPGWLVYSGPLQGVSEPLQGCHPPPHSCSGPQNEDQEECSLPFSTNSVFGSSLGFLFKCRPVWLLPGFPASIHVWPASS